MLSLREIAVLKLGIPVFQSKLLKIFCSVKTCIDTFFPDCCVDDRNWPVSQLCFGN